ncbi:hypothetical protein FRC12_007583 [Ceratobasidium sp. 428]|nr:hypothetical protein FRC12_007583 [Ceratobasidium sp. 428]
MSRVRFIAVTRFHPKICSQLLCQPLEQLLVSKSRVRRKEAVRSRLNARSRFRRRRLSRRWLAGHRSNHHFLLRSSDSLACRLAIAYYHSSLTTSIPMTPTATVPITIAPPRVISFTPSATVQRSESIRSTWTMESDRTYDSADLRPSPPFIPVDLPSVAEYEPSYSGLEDTMSVISSASPGYDVIRHHVSPPSAASMDSGLIDRLSPEISRGSDRRPSLTPS